MFSRVGSAAQTKAMKKVAGPLKLDLAQYRALAAFAQFASDLDKATRDQLTRGEKLSEVIKQPQFEPLPVSKQVTILQAATTGKLDDVPTGRVKEFETGLYRFIETEHPEIFKNLDEKPELTDDITRAITDAIDTFRRDAFGLDEAPAEKAAPADKAAPAEKAAPAGEKAPAKSEAPAEKAAPAEDADTSAEEGS